MKYTKKRYFDFAWHTYYRKLEYCYMQFRKDYKIQIYRDKKCLYDSYTHSEGLTFQKAADAKSFIEKLIVGEYNWKGDVEKYQSIQATKTAENQARQKKTADEFLAALQELNISVADFIKLYETFDNMNGESRSMVYQSEAGYSIKGKNRDESVVHNGA